MNGRIRFNSAAWCESGPELVRLLGDAFGKEHVIVHSPHHIRVRQGSALHNIWIDSSQVVKYKLADQAGRALVAENRQGLLQAIGAHDRERTDLISMREALELSKLIDSAKAALPLCGVSRAVFVDAGIKDGKAQIGLVEVAMEADGEHVRAESRPVEATTSSMAERIALEFAVRWTAPDVPIFCDHQPAVEKARKHYGDRIHWLPRSHNMAADRVANLRGKKKRNRRRRKTQAKPR